MTPSSGCAQIVPRLSMSGSLNASASGGLSRGFPSLEAHTTRIASRTGKTIVEVETDANGKPVKAWAQDRPPDPSGVF